MWALPVNTSEFTQTNVNFLRTCFSLVAKLYGPEHMLDLKGPKGNNQESNMNQWAKLRSFNMLSCEVGLKLDPAQKKSKSPTRPKDSRRSNYYSL